ncbi:MAG: hypothetical protein KKA79_03345 [Nanoarchaeota archaeon]|nr:hypothetical protein [Nanoarchaeota archaeon]MCG2717383.1 hypothetical protein [Nanoarchaeota archaeon]
MGKIDVLLGPMFSGKTTSLIKRVQELEDEGKTVKIFKPRVDNRYGEEVICSHDKISRKAYNIQDISEAEVEKVDVVVIDEYFFFKDNLLDYCKIWKDKGKHVIVAGLDLDHKGEPMPFIDSEKTSQDLIDMADEVTYLKSKCEICGKEATMTERTVESNTERLVGGTEYYRPVCKEHHPKWKK